MNAFIILDERIYNHLQRMLSMSAAGIMSRSGPSHRQGECKGMTVYGQLCTWTLLSKESISYLTALGYLYLPSAAQCSSSSSAHLEALVKSILTSCSIPKLAPNTTGDHLQLYDHIDRHNRYIVPFYLVNTIQNTNGLSAFVA